MALTQAFNNDARRPGGTFPGSKAFAITPNDSTDLAVVTRGVYVGGAGDLVVILADDTSSVTFASIPAGTLLPIRVSRVLSTSTTASSLLGVY